MRLIITALWFSILVNSFAQIGNQFPELKGETLSEDKYVIPEDTKGKYTLLYMAYSKKAEPLLKTWFQPTYDKFIVKVGMFDQFYDVNIFFIPMFVCINQSAHDNNLKKMRKKENKELFPYILYWKGRLDELKETLNIGRKDIPHLYMLDEDGKIIYFTTGRFTEKKMEAIEELLIE